MPRKNASRRCALPACGKPARFQGRAQSTDAQGRKQTTYLGYFCSTDHRAAARTAYRAQDEHQRSTPLSERITCAEWVKSFLADYAQHHKASSLGSTEQALRQFERDFGHRPIGSITRHEASQWAKSAPRSKVPRVAALFNRAVDEEIIDKNPFRKLSKKSRGRADQNPPTADEFDRLLDGCAALGDYADQMRGLLIFGAYTGMRPGELFALEWSDIDFTRNRILVSRNVYKGRVQQGIKTSASKLIALPPPARDVLLKQPTRSGSLVFVSKTGKRMAQNTLSHYWAQVKARAGLDFAFYLASKHYGVSLLYRLGLSKRAIAAQMGWSETQVDKLLAIYGHIDLIALSEVDALYEDGNVIPLPTAAQSDNTASDPALEA